MPLILNPVCHSSYIYFRKVGLKTSLEKVLNGSSKIGKHPELHGPDHRGRYIFISMFNKGKINCRNSLD